ncbi:MAG: 30S ribosomal protein S20 [Candidatus Margulisbacteria bacterium]|nr:30S ribosomal protein S20 [Candidatus Margulisiibacteriota bacterium]
MANIKSAKKRIKTARRDALKNKSVRSEVKTLRKAAEDALRAKADNKDALVKTYISRVDSAVSKGVFHRNKAARLKSGILARTK